MAKSAKGQKEGQVPEKVKFDYIKSQYFRVIHADGAYGGVTPSGFIHFALYNERRAIPRQTTHVLKPDGTLGKAIPEETVSRESVVREMEVDVLVSVSAAESLHKWLGDKIKEAKELHAKANKTRKGKS